MVRRLLQTPRYNRRRFLMASAAGTVLAGNAPAILLARNPNEKLAVAVIGCGGRGRHNLSKMASERVVALCDVNESNLQRAAGQFTEARPYKDFRRLYDDLRDTDFDAVVVSTTEHTHALATLPALLRKKHVYCEKPLTHNVLEARRITRAAETAGVATQMGTQIHAGDNYRRVVELIRANAIGPVQEVHVWVSRAWGRQSEEEAKQNRDIVWSYDRPTLGEQPPANLDWDLWLGPASERPYHSIYFPGPKWYRWWDFGNGTMSDLGSHWIDLPFWALQLSAPVAIEASGPAPHQEIAPASMQVQYEYAPSEYHPRLKLHWYQGSEKPKALLAGEIPAWKNGVLFVGNEGMLLADYGKHLLLPEEKYSTYQRPEPSIPRSLGHHEEWIHACKTGEPTTCHFGYSGLLTEANHLGNVAYRAGKRLEWDAEQLKIPNAPEAEQFLTREYRPGWRLG